MLTVYIALFVTVLELSTSSNNLTKSGTVTPAVDFSHLDEVLVVMEQKQQTGD